jgi:hypothetical protein
MEAREPSFSKGSVMREGAKESRAAEERGRLKKYIERRGDKR